MDLGASNEGLGEKILYSFFVLHNYDKKTKYKVLGEDVKFIQNKTFSKFLFLCSQIYQYFLKIASGF